MAKRTRRKEQETPALEMTPMIDVVFQLLVFFVFVMKPKDVLGHLDVFRPAPDPNAVPDEEPDTVTIMVASRAVYATTPVFINDRAVNMVQLEAVLLKMARFSTTQTILIKCDRASQHGDLIKVLDKCALAQMSNLNIVTM